MKKVTLAAAVILVCGLVGVSFAANPAGLSKLDLSGNIEKPAPEPKADDWTPFDRTGGETCATATVITALPYTDTGTTAGAINDYDEVCPFTGSTSPDVVYSYTPAADQTIDISMCTGLPETEYDTKIYVYENTCPDGGPFACNDDGCSTSFTSFASELLGLNLTAGNTYYIVVDGYGGDFGNYTIEVTEGQPWVPNIPCDPMDLLYGQDVDNDDDSWGAATSAQALWAGYSVYENFDSDYYEICDVHFYGLSLFNDGSWNACDPTGMTFAVSIYEDSAGQPNIAAPVCEYTGLAPTITDTGYFFSIDNMYAFDIDTLSPCCTLPATGTFWIMIQSEPLSTVDCGFLWMSASNDGPGDNGWQYDGAVWTPTDYDFGMCLTGTTWPVELQSFSIE